MFEIIYRYDPGKAGHEARPADATQAVARLLDGNARSIAMRARAGEPGAETQDVISLDGALLGITEAGATVAPPQKPFAAILSCADARVPPELVFHQAFNDLFTVRVAGNVVSAEGTGSLAFAAHNLGDTLRTVVVLGHTGCGAVTGAVDAYLTPSAYPEIAPAIDLRAVLDRIFVSVRAAATALDESGVGGQLDNVRYREELVRTATVLNAAQTASSVRKYLTDVMSIDLDVVCGVYDLETGAVVAPRESGQGIVLEPGLVKPPSSLAELVQLGIQLVSGEST